MSKQSKRSKGDCVYYSHLKPNRKTPIAYSTRATMDWLVLLHKNNPKATIQDIYNLLNDRSVFIYDPESIGVLQKFIDAGEGDVVPMWR